MTRPRPAVLLLWGAASVALAACSPSTSSAASTPATSSPSSAAASSTSPSPSPSPSSSSPPPATTSRAPRPHDTTELAKALIELADLPSGWSIDPPNGTDGGLTMSSSKPACADFVAIAGSANAPGSQASAHVDFSGGQNGPFISEGIDALPDRAAVSALQQRIGSANTACSSVTVTMKNAGTSTFTVRPVSAPQFGDHPVAVRITAAGGDLDGLEVTQFSTGVADTVVSLVFDGAYPEEIEQASQTAVEKATQLIGASSDTA